MSLVVKNGILPPKVQGSLFSLQIGPVVDTEAADPTAPIVDFTAAPIALYLDPPKSQAGTVARVTLTQSGDGVVAADGSTVTFTKDKTWTATLVAGTWDIWVVYASNNALLAHLTMSVVAPDKGALP